MLKHPKGLAASAFVSALLLSQSALAQPGKQGTLVVSAENLFGYLYASQTRDEDGADNTEETTRHSFTVLTDVGIQGTHFTSPRLAVDFFPIDGLSVGGMVGIGTVSLDVQNEGPLLTTDEELSGFAAIFGPRVGYAHLFNPTFGVWPRFGISYVTASVESDDSDAESESSATGVNLGVPFFVTTQGGLGLWIGPTLNYAFTGSYESTNAAGNTTDGDLDIFEFGIQVSIFGAL